MFSGHSAAQEIKH